jgi:hypothetical protein
VVTTCTVVDGRKLSRATPCHLGFREYFPSFRLGLPRQSVTVRQ